MIHLPNEILSVFAQLLTEGSHDFPPALLQIFLPVRTRLTRSPEVQAAASLSWPVLSTYRSPLFEADLACG